MNFEETKRWINRAYRIEELILLDKKKITELNELSTTIGGFNTNEKVQSSIKPGTIFEKKVFDKDEKIQELKERIKEREKIKSEIDTAINKLKDNEMIEILDYRYLQFKNFRDIAKYTYQSLGKCHYLHDKALVELSQLL